MKFIDEEFGYYLTEGMEREVLFGLKEYFKANIDYEESKGNKDYKISKFINSKVIGSIMFELLERDDIEYSEKTKKNIEYIKSYLDRCIENIEYCDNKIFLACISNCTTMKLPERFNIHLEGYYNPEQMICYDIRNANPKDKTNIIFANRENIKYSKLYLCNQIEELFVISLYEIFEKKYTIRRCKNCNKFFVTKESGKRIKYCYNLSPQNKNKTCYEYYSQMKYSEKRKNDITKRLYYQITNRIRNRKDREKNDEVSEIYWKQLEYISKKYNSMKKEVKEGKIAQEKLIEFLEDYNKKNREEKLKNNGNKRINKE